MRFKIDWASLIVGSKMPFLLCFTLYLKAIFQVQASAGGLFVDQFGGLYLEGLIFGILRYLKSAKSQSFGGRYCGYPIQQFYYHLLSFSVIFPA